MVGPKMENSADEKRPLITISIPILNEAENISRLITRLDAMARGENAYDFEFLFTDNASTDNSFELLTELAQTDTRIRVIRFSRNFGFQKSILANYQFAKGAAAIQIDADMQDPPEVIPEFLRKWEAGYKVVYGVRRRRKEFVLMNWSRSAYYALVSGLSDTMVPRNAGDFRLIDRTIIEHLAMVHDQTPYLRGLIASLGYPQIGILYDRDSRTAGASKFGLLQLISLGIDGITAQSVKPLRFMTMFGFALSVVSFFAGLYYLLVLPIFKEQIPSGFTTIVLLLLLLIGLNSFFLGLLGEYVGRIFNNTRGLPMTIVQDRIEHAEDVGGKDKRQ
ncbi:MAG: glycosyltransferase family 2 protein [Rhodospirillaceae bacterium]|jgi:polyisoprenyl-phosphate glycosyltransferase|nr:glycosyltransferase family 2 protein [Rhodospirillaceae bacterium]MBT5194605.1 glycosyltransferase family 2 protein [Rhodospirillaceae bacterium]MBT6430936.1 glycosyltransferase family 2 protein [Rhodospirillaceae bacterium]MBT7756345.1 glycosyltransferase family 2 protein [Rhodospirillaceae bacterium]